MVVVLVSCAGFHGSEATGISNVMLPIVMNPALSHLKLTSELEATHGMGEIGAKVYHMWVYILPQPDMYGFLKKLKIYIYLLFI